MPRKNLIKTKDFPYHITNRSNNQDWFPVSIEECWEIFGDFLFMAHHYFDMRIHAFVLMNNHFHLLASTPAENISLIMNQIQSHICLAVNHASQRVNHLFGARYKWSLIQDEVHYANVYRYIMQNPVRADICARVEQYKFSSLYGEIGQDRLTFPIISPTNGIDVYIPDEVTKKLQWLNSLYSVRDIATIRKALHRTSYKESKR